MTRVYVDESKRGRYLLVAVSLTDPVAVRQAVTGLILPGQRRLHMVRERDSRRRLILSTLVASGVQAVVYDAGRNYPTDVAARAACLAALVSDQGGRAAQLVLEQDDSLVRSDRLALYRAARQTGQAARWNTSMSGPAAKRCWPCLTRSLGLGPRAAIGGDGLRRSSAPSVRSDLGPRKARSPSATTVRKGLGLTSRS